MKSEVTSEREDRSDAVGTTNPDLGKLFIDFPTDRIIEKTRIPRNQGAAKLTEVCSYLGSKWQRKNLGLGLSGSRSTGVGTSIA